jgi:AAA15 family ATPase/GTPase
MIIRVRVENILSFNDEQEFSLLPEKSTVLPDHVVKSNSRDDISILKSGIIYGANASGKSNLIKIISFLKSSVIRSIKPESSIPIQPFKLSDKEGIKPSKIEIEFKTNGICYAYGQVFNSKIILEEWLYKINRRTERKIFERSSTSKSTEVVFEKVKFKSADDRQFAHFVGKGTPPNKSFMRESKERNISHIEDINNAYNWFENTLKILFPKTTVTGLEFHLDENRDLADSMTKFLSYFKTGISQLVKTEIDPFSDLLDVPNDVVKEVTNTIGKDKRAVITSQDGSKSFALEIDKEGELRAYKLNSIHLNQNGKKVHFELNEESDGTRRIIDFVPALLELTKNESVYLIDEIDRSLHPMLSKAILKYFFEATSSIKSQLIATTHESNLLDLDILRKDEIWFVEKANDGSSRLYSLSEFKPRPEKDIKKGYLNGRYGAIPFFSNPVDLNWGD